MHLTGWLQGLNNMPQQRQRDEAAAIKQNHHKGGGTGCQDKLKESGK